MHETLLELILSAANLGLSVIPVNPYKRPYVKWSPYQYAPAPRKQILAWAVEFNPWGWAIVTGMVSRVFGLDVDGPEGMALLRKFDLPEPHVISMNGGRHLYVEHPGWPVKTCQSQRGGRWAREWKGLDIRGEGGYLVAVAPGYEWTRDFEPVPFEALPEDLREAIKR